MYSSTLQGQKGFALSERKLPQWTEGDIAALVTQALEIQDPLSSTGRYHISSEGDCRTLLLATLVMKGNIKSAIKVNHVKVWKSVIWLGISKDGFFVKPAQWLFVGPLEFYEPD